MSSSHQQRSTATAPAPGWLAPLTFAVTSCAHYEHGWFTAYRHLADARPDLVLCLGDYLYEPSPRVHMADSGTVRSHVGRRATTLADFRQRHAQYKTDPDLQAGLLDDARTRAAGAGRQQPMGQGSHVEQQPFSRTLSALLRVQ